ncbi:MAG: tetratricopeptide repeat protein [Candidatus Hydrogenedentota bacterium]|nr:MAG: tetratricopeptide repeat protein [Candidatus Hydrogenedentota bacterium]
MDPHMDSEHIDVSAAIPEEFRAKPTFFAFVRDFFVHYAASLKKHMKAKKPPYLYIFIWMLGMSSVIDRIEIKALQNQAYAVENWGVLWGMILVGGIVSGYVAYHVGGAVYHFRVWLSGGSKDRLISRNLFLYTGIPIYAVAILSQATDTVVYGDKYFAGQTNASLDLTWTVVAVAAILYSITLSYRGVRLLQETKPVRSVLLFIALPVVFYSLMFGLGFAAEAAKPGAVEYNRQALTLMYEGKFAEAEELYNLAIKDLNPDERENAGAVYANLALMHRFAGDTDKAIENYEKSRSFCEPDSAGYHSTTGRINILRGDIGAAIGDFERALEIDPDDFDAHNSLGLIFLGEFDEDRTDYKRALIHNERTYAFDGDTTAAQNLAINYFALGRYSEAQPLFESVDEAFAQNAIAKYYLGLVHYYGGNVAEAKAYLQAAVALNPSLHDPGVESILTAPDTQN